MPNEIDDDSFWQEFRRRVKAINPEAYIVGEIWDAPERWLQGDQFDGVMNYLFRKAVMKFLFDEHPISTEEFCSRLREAFPEGRGDIPMNLLGSHDTTRLRSQPCASWDRIRLALTLMFFLPGAPCVYYGEELGMEGGKDPDNRRSVPWEKLSQMQKEPVFALVKELTEMRKSSAVLRDGKLEIACNGDGFDVKRTLGRESLTLHVATGTPDPSFEIR